MTYHGQKWFTLVPFLLSAAAYLAQAQEPLSGPCPIGRARDQFVVRHAAIEDPWKFLRFFRNRADEAAKAVNALQGKRYSPAEVKRITSIVEQDRFFPVNFLYSTTEVKNCSGGQLDLVFFVFSMQVSPDIHLSYESREQQNDDPAKELISSDQRRKPQIHPQIGYDATDGFFAGGDAEIFFRDNRVSLDKFAVQGYGSSSLRWTTGTLSGHHDYATGWLAHADWASNFTSFSAPTTTVDLNRARLDAQFSASSRPANGAVLRFGFVAGGGNEQSGFNPASLATDVVPSSGYSGLRLFGGVTEEGNRNALAVSYGLELGGSTNTSLLNDWRKHIGDAAFDFWLPFGDHRLFEVEQHFTAGAVDINRQVPVGELFFGGNRETYFVANEGWKIRSNPYIRSLPANSFYRTSSGSGAQNFLAYNLTAGINVWHMPLMPPEIKASESLCRKLVMMDSVPPSKAMSKDLCQKLNGAFVTVTNTLQAANAVADIRLKQTLAEMPVLQSKLSALTDAVKSAQSGAPASLDPLFAACGNAIQASTDSVNSAISEKPNAAYEIVEELLPDGESPLSDVTTRCGGDLNHALNNSQVAATSETLQTSAGQFQAQLKAIDDDANAKAATFISYVKRMLYRVLSEVNIVSVSPVGMFDVARIAPATSGPYSGTKYGVGGGVRVTLASTVSFTAGYSWNVDRQPGEDPGAFSVSLTTRNLFH